MKQCGRHLSPTLWLAMFLIAAISTHLLGAVKVWEEDVVIPTYIAGEPEPNPMFYFGRASQGAEGRIYPYPLFDTLTGEKAEKTYTMVYLENEYIKIGIAPEIGGRIFEGRDKTNNYDFFYKQHVIKPALIGLIGAWISGGVEWNIPHHHRASTFMPVQHRIVKNPDGSETVWVGELELRHRMRWAVGYTLYPGKSYLEVSLRILNRTPVVNSMLCFANVAVHVNEDYQVVFPPSTQFGTYHSKREFTTWPIGSGRYTGYDFTDIDMSWYKNHIQPTSVFAWNYEDDFFAGYDHGQRAGLMSYANHHIVPGKKLWTWGNGPRGRMWDKILTDDDGPYIELMVGAYSDNQPDYSWLQPYEVKSFKQYWYPFRDIGGVKNANLDAAVNLDVKDGVVTFGFYTTSALEGAQVTLKIGDKVLHEETINISPDVPYTHHVTIPIGTDEHDLRASITVGKRELIAYSPIRLEHQEMPETVKAPLDPKDIETVEELYLTGLRIEQFHNPSRDPDPYWNEALRRDPGDVRVNTAMGINCLKRARYVEAEAFFRKALERLTDKYTSPKNGEPFYYLGVTLKAQGKNDEAYDAFYKATWSMAWRAAAYYGLAEIASLRRDNPAALDLVNRSLEANALNVRALNLKAAILRRMNRKQQALKLLTSTARKTDPLDVRTLAEGWLAGGDPKLLEMLQETLISHPATALETAAEYVNAGFWRDGSIVLQQLVEAVPDKSRISPMVYYYLGYFAQKMNQPRKAQQFYRLARQMPTDYVFPFQNEAIDVLRQAMETNPEDPRAPYYLGNLLFDWQPDQAVMLWEKSVSLGASFPIVYRNLAVAYSRGDGDDALKNAIASLEKAVSLPEKYPLNFYELDQFYEAAGTQAEKRLAVLEDNHDVVVGRDDALSREISLKVVMGKYDEAIELMTGRQFDVWEGASLDVSDSWTNAHLLRGQEHLLAGRNEKALADFETAINVPDNLPSERRGSGVRVAEVAYWKAVAHEAQGHVDKAKELWTESSTATEPRWGGDAPRYYKALSLKKLGRDDEAKAIFDALVESGKQSLERSGRIDFFAKFGEQQFQRTRLANAHYTIGLGQLGLGDKEAAKAEFTEALKANPAHLGARTELARLK